MKYEIIGDSLPVVICHLDNNESMFNEGGAMAWMSPNMKMETTSNGGFGKALGRMFAGEKIFQNISSSLSPGEISSGPSVLSALL